MYDGRRSCKTTSAKTHSITTRRTLKLLRTVHPIGTASSAAWVTTSRHCTYTNISSRSATIMITWQPFTAFFTSYNTTLSVTGTDRNAGQMTFSSSGHVQAPVVSVSNNGCDAADFPENVKETSPWFLAEAVSTGSNLLSPGRPGPLGLSSTTTRAGTRSCGAP